MASENETGVLTLTVTEAVAKFRRVAFSGTSVALASASQLAVGTATIPATASGDEIGVKLRNAPGTRKMVASGSISAGAAVYAAASGKIASSGTVIEGTAMEAASADGDIIEVMPVGMGSSVVAGTATVAATGSVQGDAAALSPGLNSVSAADGTKGVILPLATGGQFIAVYNEHASNGLKIYPNTSDTINGGTANAAITIEGKTQALLYSYDAVNWGATFTANT